MTLDERKVKASILEISPKGVLLEERDPKTKKLVSTTIHELDENDQLVAVKAYF